MEPKPRELPQEFLDDPKGFVQRKLQEFHDAKPSLPADPIEQERRRQLSYTDPILNDLHAQHKDALGDHRYEVYAQLADRRWAIMTADNPEQLIQEAIQAQNSQPS